MKMLSKQNFEKAAKFIKDIVDNSIDYVISQQTNNMNWSVPDSFGEEEGFRVLERKYNVHFTTLRLVMLRRFERIEG